MLISHIESSGQKHAYPSAGLVAVAGGGASMNVSFVKLRDVVDEGALGKTWGELMPSVTK